MTDETNTNEPAERPQAEGQGAASPESASLAEQLEATRAERDRNYDLALRTQAELENYRRRAARERDEDAKYRVLPLAKDLLPAVDNLRRAVEAAGKTGSAEELIRGVEMVLRQLDAALEAHGVKPIRSEGEKLDPNRHEALTQVPSPGHEPLTVLQEVERGYTLHDRVLRPSKVIVAAPPVE